MTTLMECTYEDIERLNDVALTKLLQKLLGLESQTAGIAAMDAYASLNVDAPDGGDDGRIKWSGGPDHTNWIPARFSIFQCKATPLNSSQCKKEMQKNKSTQLKPRIKEVLDDGGAYVLFYGRSCNTNQQAPLIEKMREAIHESGAAYSDTCNIQILDANQIARWASEHLPAAMFVFRASGRPLPNSFESWESWSAFPTIAKFQYASGDPKRDVALQQLRAHLSSGPRMVARLAGLSGLGKTRLALEVFRPSVNDRFTPRLSDRVLYLDAQELGTDLFAAVNEWRREGRHGILVVDNCPKDRHSSLTKHIQHLESQLSLLTIGPEPEPDAISTDSFPYIQLHPVDEKIIRDMLSQDYSGLAEADLNFIVRELAHGFPQMAALIAEARLENRDIKNIVPSDLLRKLLGVEPGSEEFLVISTCALFTHLGFLDKVAGEYKWIAKFCGLAEDKYYEHVKRFLNRGVLAKFGNFVQVRPEPLAMRLAADWWTNCSPDKASKLLEGDIPEALAKTLCDRVRVLDYVPEVKKFVADLCGDQRPFGQAKVLNSELGSRLFRSLVEVNPEATATALARAFSGWGVDDFLKIGPGRRNLVWALQKLCFWRSTFPRAARILILFSAAENENWSNNSTGILIGFFKLVLSGTQAEPKDRFLLVDDALSHADPRCRILGVRALGSALQTGHFIGMVGPEQQGSRFPEQEWRPKFHKDTSDYLCQALKRLKEVALRDESLASLAQGEIAHHIRGLVLAGCVKDLDEALVPIISKAEGFWPAALDAVQTSIEYDFDGLPEEGKNHLEKWLLLLQPKEFAKRLTLLVSEAPWETRQNESGLFIDVAAQKAEAFAEEAASRIPKLIELLPQILVGSQNQGFVFGQRLGQVTADLNALTDSSLTALEGIDPAQANPSVVMGLFAAARDRDESLLVEALNRVEHSERLRPHIVNLVRATRVSEHDLDRILRLVESNQISPDRLRGLSYGRGLDHIDPSVIGTFSDRLVALGVGGAWAALDVIFMYTHGSPEKWDHCASAFRKIVFVSDLLLVERGTQNTDTHAYEVTCKKLLKRDDPQLAEHISKEIVKVARQESSRYDLDHVLAPIVEVLLAKYLETAWPIFAKGLTEEWRTEFQLNHFLGSRFGVKEQPGLISKLESNFLLSWCEQDPIKHPVVLAKMVNVAERKEGDPPRFSNMAKALIDRYGDNEEVLDALGVNMGSFSWVGSLVPYYEEQAKIASPLLDHPKQKVREWAGKIVGYAQRQAQRERDRDEEHQIGLW